MLILLEYYSARPVGGREQLVRLCPVCGKPFVPGQIRLGLLDRATSGYYEVHDGCETGLPTYIETLGVNYDGDLSIAC